MNKTKNLLIVIIAGVFVIALFAFNSNSNQHKQFTYMTIVAEGGSNLDIFISTNGFDHKKITVKGKDVMGDYDYNPIIKILRGYEEMGWELVNNNFSYNKGSVPYVHNYFLLRKEK